jgi:hypothetical protein
MSAALVNASRLKPDIRLAQAVSEFEAILTSDQKTAFRSHKSQLQSSPPDQRDIMQLISKIDKTSGVVASRHCFGP